MQVAWCGHEIDPVEGMVTVAVYGRLAQMALGNCMVEGGPIRGRGRNVCHSLNDGLITCLSVLSWELRLVGEMLMPSLGIFKTIRYAEKVGREVPHMQTGTR